MLYAPDVLAARDVLDAALWDALQGGNGRPPLDVLKALQDARVKARRHLAQAAGAAVPTVQITPRPCCQPWCWHTGSGATLPALQRSCSATD